MTKRRQSLRGGAMVRPPGVGGAYRGERVTGPHGRVSKVRTDPFMTPSPFWVVGNAIHSPAQAGFPALATLAESSFSESVRGPVTSDADLPLGSAGHDHVRASDHSNWAQNPQSGSEVAQ